MKIVFEGSEYGLNQLNELLNNYPKATELIQFIHDWENGKNEFQLKTSGSTGPPKQIIVSREQLEASARATAAYLSLQKHQHVLLPLAPNFVASIMMAARCLVLDMDLFLEKPIANPLNNIDYSVDFASFVPVQIYQMIEDGNLDQLEGIKNILIGGAPLSSTAFHRIAQLNTSLYLTYGMTETVSHIALMPIKGEASQACYEILPGISVRQDSAQCLEISGAVTRHEWIRTNDLVEMLSDHKFRWLGRRDHVINSGGIKIHPEQLEQTIAEVIKPGVNYLISWIEDDRLGATCALITEEKELSRTELRKVQEIIEQRFSKYHVPKSLLMVDRFLRTDSGKILRENTRRKALGLS